MRRGTAMTRYRLIGADKLEKDDIPYWKLTFDGEGDAEGTILFASDPPPDPFAGLDTSRTYTDADLSVLRSSGA
jgi:hypothetical protein